MNDRDLSYDVVVVGGGSAGCVVASVMAQAGVSVILLEAGGSDTNATDLLDATRLPIGPGSTRIDTFAAELMPGIPTNIARGRVLGGSGAVNGCYFVRAPRTNFRSWPSDRWSWSVVDRYYRAVERRMPLHSGIDSTVGIAFAAACEFAGYPTLSDAADIGDGFFAVPSNVENGYRISTAHAFLASTPQVDIRTGVRVTQVLLRNLRARGVRCVDAQGSYVVHADTVVLTAGAVWTPTLLMHSGIGPSNALRNLGIEVRIGLQGVGSGFQDHPEVAVPYTSKASVEPETRSRLLDMVLHVGDVEIRPYTSSFDNIIQGLTPSNPFVGVALMTPESRGHLELASADPLERPRLHYRYLESGHDRARLEVGIALTRELMQSSSGVMSVAADAPLRHRLGTSVHMCSTARMGFDSGSVVDARCAVHEAEGLFVMDSSMLPEIPSRGPHATVVMAALRAAELWVEEHVNL